MSALRIMEAVNIDVLMRLDHIGAPAIVDML